MAAYVTFGPAIHHRRSIRLEGYDYSEAGLYFVTICTRGKECLFGEVRDGTVVLNQAGLAVQSAWFNLSRGFAGLELDANVIMPSHVHGILFLVGAGLAPPDAEVKRGTASRAPTSGRVALGDVVGAFKSFSAIEVNRILGRHGQALWQRNYYEHIVRRGRDLDEIREYIRQNPLNWNQDPENPSAT